ncbi:MAG TPA: hypothetical protein VHE23_07190 [Candidatus Acidoferrales bacterium]|nr:hypothetical protein [Candidatus Acidoferrales bacterium]
MPVSEAYTFPRGERRIPMGVGVILDGHSKMPGKEKTFTENVSARGARVVTVRRWTRDERLTVHSRAGDFRSLARVAYCESLHGTGFAIGVEFLEPQGRWVVQSTN